MKLRTILLACTVFIVPSVAQAGPITAFFAGLGFTSATTAAVAAALYPGAFAIGSFFTTALGSILLNVGLSYLLAPKPKAPDIDAARVNSRLPDAKRWQAGGTVAVGGEAGIFGEHDADGNFWYIVAHADSELTGTPTYILDGIEVELSDGTGGFTAGDVLTDDFCLTDKFDQYEGTGTRVPFFRIYTVTPDASNIYGAKPAAFTTAFPDLPADFFLAGVAYSIVRCAAIKPQHYSKAYRWRGPIGIGEPSVNVVANFSRMYDPREVSHDPDDSTTWTPSDGNPAIVWAWWRTNPRGRNRPVSEINWDLVAAAADACDELVEDKAGNDIPRYRCGVAFPDSKQRYECEQEILATMAGYVAYDDAGRAYPVAGVYTAPTLEYTYERDILTSQTLIVDDAEAQIDGVIVEYISPEHGWTKVEAAPWINTAYYNAAAEPRFKTVSILGCQSHNQAVRLAKAIGLEAGATKRAAITTTLKGILARGQRNITLSLDDEFDGVFKIASPVELSADGQACAFAVVPMTSGDFDLAEGEEGAPPALTPALDIDDTLEAAQNVQLRAVNVQVSGGQAVRLEATFDDPGRVDRAFRFRVTETGEAVYAYFTTDMDEGFAYSAIVSVGTSYDVSWQTVTAGGRASEWSTAETIVAEITPVDIADLTEPAPSGSSLVVTGLAGGDVTVIGDGYWWRNAATGQIVTSARWVALFDGAEYQIDHVDKTRAQTVGLTRASAATYVDEVGVVQTAATDVARFDYLSGSRCLLVEPAATNLFERSAEFDNAYWSKSRASVSANTVAAPDGTVTAETLTDDATTGTHAVFRSGYPWSAGQIYAMSVFAKQGTLSQIMMQLGSGGAAFPSAPTWQAKFDLATGTVTSQGSSLLDADIVALGNGWYRCWIIGQAAAAASENAGLAYLLSGGVTPYAGTGTGSVHLWGAQLETDRVTSHIPTAGATASRAADVASMRGITATLDLAVTYGDGSTETLAGQSVSLGFWPTMSDTAIRTIIGRTA